MHGVSMEDTSGRGRDGVNIAITWAPRHQRRGPRPWHLPDQASATWEDPPRCRPAPTRPGRIVIRSHRKRYIVAGSADRHADDPRKRFAVGKRWTPRYSCGGGKEAIALSAASPGPRSTVDSRDRTQSDWQSIEHILRQVTVLGSAAFVPGQRRRTGREGPAWSPARGRSKQGNAHGPPPPKVLPAPCRFMAETFLRNKSALPVLTGRAPVRARSHRRGVAKRHVFSRTRKAKSGFRVALLQGHMKRANTVCLLRGAGQIPHNEDFVAKPSRTISEP